jgi:hypothetical protein
MNESINNIEINNEKIAIKFSTTNPTNKVPA